MKWCEHCKVHVNTDRKVCPLCFNSLKSDTSSGISMDNKVENGFKTYPSRKIKKKKKSIAYKIFAFLCLVSILTTGIINFFTHKEGEIWWSLIVLFGVIYVYTLVRSTILSKIYIIKRLVIQEIIISIVLFAIDKLSGDIGWSYEIVIPLVLISTNMANAMILMINRKHFSDGFISMIGSLFIGFIPFILQLCNVIDGEGLWAPLVSACVSVCILSGIFIFGGRSSKEELEKRFHV